MNEKSPPPVNAYIAQKRHLWLRSLTQVGEQLMNIFKRVTQMTEQFEKHF